MRVTRLEIFGFKSFRDRFVLNFDEDLLGIVGPNGCGKSNIVDALRWVLGETHAKHLRGTVLEDLIFNGSESHRPLGMAEVSITVRPDARWASLQNATPSEQSLTEGSEVTKLRIVPDKVDDGQETADESSENDAASEQERTSALTGYLPSSLLEIPGLFDATEIQLTRRLYRSGESEYFINRIPCRLRDLTDVYRLIGLGARGLSIVQQGQISEIITRKPIERRELLEEAAGISGFRNRIEVASRKLDTTKENIARITDIIGEVDKQVRQLKRQAARARDRNELKEKLRALELDVFRGRTLRLKTSRTASEKQKSELETDLQGSEAQLQLLTAQEIELRNTVETLDLDVAEVRRSRDQILGKFQEFRERENAFRLELARTEGREKAIDDENVRLSERQEQIVSELESRSQALTEDEAKLKEVEAQKRISDEKLKEIQNEARSTADSQEDENSPALTVQAEISSLMFELEQLPLVRDRINQLEAEERKVRSRLHQHREQLHETRVRIAAIESEIRALRQQLDALGDETTQGVLAELLGEESLTDSGSTKRKTLHAVFTLPEGPESVAISAALHSALGDAARFVLGDDAIELARRFERLRKAGAEAPANSFGVIQNGGTSTRNRLAITHDMREVAGSVRLLLDEVQVDPAFSNLANLFLGQTLLVDTVDEALALRDLLVGSIENVQVVTTGGQLVTALSWSFSAEQSGRELLRKRLLDLQQQLQEFARRESEFASATATLEQEMRSGEVHLREQIEVREKLISSQNRLSVLVQQEKSREKAEREIALQDERKVQAEARELTGQIATLRGRVEFEQRRLSELKEEQVHIEQHREELGGERDKLANSRNQIQDQLSALRSQSDAPDEQGLKSQLQSLEQDIRSKEAERGRVRLNLGEISQSLQEIRSGRQEKSNALQAAILNCEKSEFELQLLFEDVKRIWGEEIAAPTDSELEDYASRNGEAADVIESNQRQALDLRKRLDREGEVDPQSIELYEQERTRFEEMSAQLSDLEQASTTLENTIRHLKDISRERFVETFSVVSEKFSELVPRLFGGGAGKLELINPDDPLTSGVEISMRPPGKNLRTLELLSGGEKALGAVALLISMFLHHPSPICVLDEVDAPLDDTNLQRFMDLVKDISHETQFLIITHNKLTMAVADRLVGITMQEKGVSTALSVSFEEAERDLERWAANM